MGFGSYDESEQEKQSVDADFDEGATLNTDSSGHDGAVEFEFTESNDELLDRLGEMKDES